jgi:hypothetical protein
VLGERFVKGHPVRFTPGAVQVQQGRAIAADGDLGFLAGNLKEVSLWHASRVFLRGAKGRTWQAGF